MQIKNKTLIILSSALLLVILIAVLILIKPVKNLISFVEQKKDNISLGIKAIEVNEELREAVGKKEAEGIDVLHYSIAIDLFPAEKKINGDVIINMKLGGLQSNKIDLDFYKNLNIKSVLINNKTVKYEQSEKTLSVFRDNHTKDTVDLRIIYEGTPKSLGFGSFNFPKVDDKHYVYTMNEPVYASTWFPCIDITTDKALTDIYITNDSSMVSLSNGKLINTSTKGSRRTYHWKTYYPISTYLISIYSADYEIHSETYISTTNDTINLYCYATPEKIDDLRKDFSHHKSYLNIFEELFGPYPFPKEKYGLAEFWWNYGAMENQTITGVGTKYITGKKFFADMLIHELAHHWWGNAVTPKTWMDIWLNEGFATYSEALYWEKKSGFSALQSTLNPKFGTFDNGTLYNPVGNLFSRMIYDKGAWVLHMLRKELGDENFFKLLRKYFNEYKYKNTSTEDLRKLCEQISKKNLKYFFDQWIYKGEGIIELEYNWNVEQTGEDFTATVYIEQLQNGYDIYKFPLEIKFTFENKRDTTITKYIDKYETVISVNLESEPVDLKMDPEKWLLAIINKKSD